MSRGLSPAIIPGHLSFALKFLTRAPSAESSLASRSGRNCILSDFPLLVQARLYTPEYIRTHRPRQPRERNPLRGTF